MELFFDTETSDKFNFKTAKYTDDNFPWPVQIAMVLADKDIVYAEANLIIIAGGRTISDGAAKVHNISTEVADTCGISEFLAANVFIAFAEQAETLVAHNYNFDSQILAASFYRNSLEKYAHGFITRPDCFCTMKNTTDILKLPGNYGNYKWPKLSELYRFLFGEDFVGAHDAMFDVRATMKCYYELKKRELI